MDCPIRNHCRRYTSTDIFAIANGLAKGKSIKEIAMEINRSILGVKLVISNLRHPKDVIGSYKIVKIKDNGFKVFRYVKRCGWIDIDELPTYTYRIPYFDEKGKLLGEI
jgi:hypothetical protein